MSATSHMKFRPIEIHRGPDKLNSNL